MKRILSILLALFLILNLTAANIVASNFSSSRFSSKSQEAYQALIKAIQKKQPQVDIPNINLNERNQFNSVLRYEHPEFFFLKKIKPGTLHTYPDGDQYEEIHLEYDTNAQKALQSFLAQAPRNGSDYNKELYVHNRLVKETEFQSQSSYDNDNCQAVYDCLVNHQAGYAGYAYAMKVLLNQLGISCEVLHGKSSNGEAFMWNRVTLNGKDYLTDTALDDPLDTSGSQPIIYYQYFNLSQKEMDRDHIPDRPEEEASCVYTDQGYYKKNGLYFTSVEDAESAMKELLKTETVVAVQLETQDMAKQVLTDFFAGKITERTRGAAKSQYQNGLANNVVIVRVGNFE